MVVSGEPWVAPVCRQGGAHTMTKSVTGYSGTPLAAKLGIKAGHEVHVQGAPPTYRERLDPLPPGVRFVTRVSKTTDVIHCFVSQRSWLSKALRGYRKATNPGAILWISWPKKSSGQPTDITEDTIRELALPLGFVDVKVCAVDETWSGLKLVVRKELR